MDATDEYGVQYHSTLRDNFHQNNSIQAFNHNDCHYSPKGKDQSSKEDDKVQCSHHIELPVGTSQVTISLITVSLWGEGRGGACVSGRGEACVGRR